MPDPDPAHAVRRAGGIVRRQDLLTACTRHAIDRALLAGDLIRLNRSVLALPHARTAILEARAAGAVLAGPSAALHRGWAVAQAPGKPVVILPRNRGRQPTHLAAHRRDLPPNLVDKGVLTPVATVIDCARTLEFGEALAVADSSLRSRAVTREELFEAAHREPRNVRRQVLRVVGSADGRAANPFESVARARAIEVGLEVQPQYWIDDARPDMADPGRCIVVECDSYEFHSLPEHFRHDVRRYTKLSVAGWIVVRLVWEDVMFKPDEVRATLRTAKDLADSRVAR